MYKIGDLIIYGSSGVCKVEYIGASSVPGISKDRKYYTLDPLYQDGKIFIPVDTKVFMRPIISYEEAQRLISLIPSIEEEKFNYDSNMRAIEEYYKSFLKNHDCLDLLTLVKILYAKKDEAESNNKKLTQTDEKFMNIAQSLINEEFAAALEIPVEEVPKYIADKMDSTME